MNALRSFNERVLRLALLASIACGGSESSGPVAVVVPVASVTISGPSSPVVVRGIVQFTPVVKDGAGNALANRSVAWSSSNPVVAVVDSTGSVIALSAGSATISAVAEGHQAAADLTVQQGTLPVRGLWVQFERRGWASGYFPGNAIRDYNTFDDVVGTTQSAELAAQLDAIKGLGVNTITVELRSSTMAAFDPPAEAFPACNVNPTLGLLWPQPASAELDNLVAFFDLVQSKGIRVWLSLTNARMDAKYRTEAATWLGAILGRIKAHPALDLVVFAGDDQAIDSNGDGIADKCGGKAEPPLWLGPTSYAATYVQWAIGFAQSLGIPARKLSAEAIVGNYSTDAEGPAGSEATDRHLWNGLGVLKTIFDNLSIPDDQRTYALSFYEHRKCRDVTSTTCVDLAPAEWAEETIKTAFTRIGVRSRARVVAPEMGVTNPLESGWGVDQSVESLVQLMRKYGIDGGSFWRWTNFDNSEDANSGIPNPIKRRGVSYTYNPVRDVLFRLYTSP